MQMIESTVGPAGTPPTLAIPDGAVDAELLAGAIEQLDAILDRHTFGFVHLDRAQLIDRIERVRAAALAAKLMLTEQRPVWWES
jgi:hypothetical protein